jgi:hypothetical protein
MEENKRVVFSIDYKVWINRIIEILELYKKYYPEKYGKIDTNKTKSYMSKDKIIVAYQEENWESAICEFPTIWLSEKDESIMNFILQKKNEV